MKKGRLSQSERNKLNRIWCELNVLQAKIPASNRTPEEDCVLDCLVSARNRLGELLRWQAPQTLATR